jgi:uncharacterized SAM-binding protein YcdF (DUF218 family)
MSWKKRTTLYLGLIVLVLATGLFVFSGTILSSIGELLVVDEPPVRSDAAVVLNTGLEYYSRLIQAADLYRKGFAQKVVINGNRKSEVLKGLEKQGFRVCCPWYEESVRILELLGVPRKKIVTISVEDAYDTVSEAKAVGKSLLQSGISRIIISTSKSHTRRARFIWKSQFQDRLSIRMAAASSDPYSPEGWWKEGRQVKWVLAEYGAWLYYFWKEFSCSGQ